MLNRTRSRNPMAVNFVPLLLLLPVDFVFKTKTVCCWTDELNQNPTECEIFWSKVLFMMIFCPFSTRIRVYLQIFILKRLSF